MPTSETPGIPARVRVGCLTYRVLTDVAAINAASEAADIADGAEWTAYSDHDHLIVGINPDNPTGVQRRDLLHEVIHCCLRLSGVEPNTYARIVARAKGRHGGYTVEEFAVAAATGPLLGVLRDNPDLTRWLLDADE
jgi:hypothetical protein